MRGMAVRWQGWGILLGVSLLAAGCGYRPHGVGSGPPEIQRVHVAALTNDTFKPGLQSLVSAAILRRLHHDGRIRLTAPEAADAVLAGSVTGYQNDAIAFDRSDIGRRFRVRITLQVRLATRDGDKALLREEIVGEALYTVGVSVVGTQAAEDEAATRAANDLAERVATRLLEGF